jgi:uncharacterized iron-regulated membrane protein
MQWNGVGAAGLLVLAISGLLLWWHGVATWWRTLGVAWQCGWRRVNYDLQHALGFLTFIIVLWWSLSGVYFAWYHHPPLALETADNLNRLQSYTFW